MAKVTLKKIDDAPGKALGEVRGYARKIWLAGIGAYALIKSYNLVRGGDQRLHWSREHFREQHGQQAAEPAAEESTGSWSLKGSAGRCR